ncbi:hypothetical protein AX15_003841 [Amanita polypyramis BW_CC]|nr:hypothetical protein AX15_003841 [Amanita polypyramis BW_CC]
MANRLTQLTGHLTNTYGRGLLAGEVAIITGAGQGIGKSAALLFAKEGAKIVASDIDEKRLNEVVAEIKAAGGDAIGVSGDVAANDFPKRIVDAAVKAYGKINHIVNNAGFTIDKMLHTTSDEVFDIIMNIHVRAPFRIIREAAPYFRIKKGADRENRSIINVSSTSGLHGNVGQTNYSAAKSAVIGMTKTIAREWGPLGVRANTVAYGVVQTRLIAAKGGDNVIEYGGKKVELGIPTAEPKSSIPSPESLGEHSRIPLGRPGTADEAAAAMLFLSSPLASYVSGHTLEVTGGLGI